MKCLWKKLLVLASVALLSSASVFGAEEGWLVDFNAAKEQAAKEGKEIFMEFTGSDWCPPCISFKKKVLDTEVFKTAAPEGYVLLKLDSPRDKSKQSPEESEQYKKLSAEYKITGVPTVILAAQDDPIIPFRSFQTDAIRQNPAIRLVAPRHGGHCGFIQRRRPGEDRHWAENRILEAILSA